MRRQNKIKTKMFNISLKNVEIAVGAQEKCLRSHFKLASFKYIDAVSSTLTNDRLKRDACKLRIACCRTND